MSVIQQHPLMEMSQSPGHFLLLKLWQREEDMFGRRVTMKETRMDNFKSKIFQLCCCFYLFVGFFLTLLYTSSVNSFHDHHSCKNWWLPSIHHARSCIVQRFNFFMCNGYSRCTTKSVAKNGISVAHVSVNKRIIKQGQTRGV
ncbi:hypothetical protein MKW94_003630 [Papaver nudicaule]|uniref:Transmembrane protein n=1 Tax=Papaver nudicaule TaxID=74823 RepID=A0AA41VHP1_PAPNU|nr:hypothetical protein [Papaver nudicaule]